MFEGFEGVGGYGGEGERDGDVGVKYESLIDLGAGHVLFIPMSVVLFIVTYVPFLLRCPSPLSISRVGVGCCAFMRRLWNHWVLLGSW